MATTYDYPGNRAYNETIATLEDGRTCLVNTQYGTVAPLGQHADTCDQVNTMGGRCDCGLSDGIDVAALVADARVHGLRGPAPQPTSTPAAELPKSRHVCPHCHTYCDGDCQA